MTEIGSCPWPGCGGAASTHDLDPGAWRNGEWCVECDRCNAQSPTMPTEAAAIAAWNRLAGPDVVIGRLRWEGEGRDVRLMLGSFVVGRLSISVHGFHWGIETDKIGIPAKDEHSARAALVEAVRKAMGGGE